MTLHSPLSTNIAVPGERQPEKRRFIDCQLFVRPVAVCLDANTAQTENRNYLDPSAVATLTDFTVECQMTRFN